MQFLVFAGTTEGRRVLEQLVQHGCAVTICVATEYGGAVFADYPGCTVLTGRLDQQGMEELLRQNCYDGVIDATHPYAVQVTENIQAACDRCGVECIRILRDPQETAKCVHVPHAAAAADYLCTTQGRILLTTGSKELAVFTRVPDYQERLFPRVLPVRDSLEQCLALGFPARNILCMQGPFSEELNAALLRQIGASGLLTKESGAAGGFAEKASAAHRVGAELIVIGRPSDVQGISLQELPALLKQKWNLCADHDGSHLTPAAPSEPASDSEQAPFFPLFVNLAGQTVVIIGGGKIAARRIQTLCGFGCHLRVIAPEICPAVECLAGQHPIQWEQRPYRKGDCMGAALAVAATPDRLVNQAVGMECHAAGIPVSVADRKEECSFYFPGVIRNGGAVVGVTGGGNHHRARRIADRIRADAAHWDEEE